jgi:hypothetical protein
MSEDNVQKKALKEKYLNDIAQELDAELKNNISKSQSLRSIKFDEKGEIWYAPLESNPAPFAGCFEDSIQLINYLASELANTKIELYLLKQKTEIWLQTLSTTDKTNKA